LSVFRAGGAQRLPCWASPLCGCRHLLHAQRCVPCTFAAVRQPVSTLQLASGAQQRGGAQRCCSSAVTASLQGRPRPAASFSLHTRFCGAYWLKIAAAMRACKLSTTTHRSGDVTPTAASGCTGGAHQQSWLVPAARQVPSLLPLERRQPLLDFIGQLVLVVRLLGRGPLSAGLCSEWQSTHGRRVRPPPAGTAAVPTRPC